MWLVNIIVIFLILGGTFLCYSKQHEWLKDIDRKVHKLYVLYPLSDEILVRLGLDKLLLIRKNFAESMKALQHTGKPELLHKLFWCNRLAQVILVLFVINIISFFSYLADISNTPLMNGRYLARPDYGEGNTEVNLSVTLENEDAKEDSNESLNLSQDVSIEVGERRYTEEEVESLFQDSIVYLQKEVLGDNESKEKIYYNLDFCKVIPGTSIHVDWIPEDYSLIQSNGTVFNEDIEENGVLTSVTAVLTYYSFKKEKSFEFNIMPRQYTEEEIMIKQLEEAIKTYDDQSNTNELLELPDNVDGNPLHWMSKKNSNSAVFMLLGILLAVLTWVLGDRELEKQLRLRKEQMLMDYPEIINKFTLLVNAGMTIKQSWYKITEDYDQKRALPGFEKRYAYEEMITAAHELRLGLADQAVYEQYGRRTGLIPYIKFSSLISQNLKKGTKGFTELLVQEAAEAFENRKETAKRQGEEAGTKLLFPMMILLLIVLLIIMIPAFMAFQI